MKFKIGDIIENTDAFGTVKVLDVLKSETSDSHCYHVRCEEDACDFLCFEGELVSGAWKAE